MEKLLKQYQSLPSSIARYLPNAKSVSVEELKDTRCSNIGAVYEQLDSLFAKNTLQGWVTCQSSTHLIDGSQTTAALPALGTILDAEFAAGELSVNVHYDSNDWRVYAVRIRNQEDGNSIATEHFFAADSLRFSADTQLCYQVIWQMQSGEPVARSQYFVGLENLSEGTHHG